MIAINQNTPKNTTHAYCTRNESQWMEENRKPIRTYRWWSLGHHISLAPNMCVCRTRILLLLIFCAEELFVGGHFQYKNLFGVNLMGKNMMKSKRIKSNSHNDGKDDDDDDRRRYIGLTHIYFFHLTKMHIDRSYAIWNESEINADPVMCNQFLR